jgi:lantibiotic transport system permease protein
MKTLWHVLRAETMKMRRTLALALAFIAPLSITLMQFGILIQRGPLSFDNSREAWLYICQSNLVMWSLVMLPLFVTLETALIAGIEHNNQTWKKLFALPVPRWMTVAAKQFSGLLLIALSCLVLWALTLVMGLTLQAINPDFGLSGVPPWDSLLVFSALVFLASWLIIAINTWVALNWKSFVVASAFGIIATVSGAIVINSETFGQYYPWAIAGLVGNQFNEGVILWPQVWIGLIGGLVALLITNLLLSRKQVL